jgi:hypothetical protein
MLLDEHTLLVVQGCGFVEYGGRDHEHTDVMQQGGQAQGFTILGR